MSKTLQGLDISSTSTPIIAHVEPSNDVVDFDSPYDLDNALDWSQQRKWSIVLLICFMTFTTSISTLILAPSAPVILTDFHSSNSEITALLVSIWELGEAIAPLLIAPLSETYGRVPVYHIANIIFIVASVCNALSVNLTMLCVFRFLNGVAVGAVALNPAIVGDIFVQEQRGKALAAQFLPILLAPIVGPIAGGFLTERLGWRWTCWLSAIMSLRVGFYCRISTGDL